MDKKLSNSLKGDAGGNRPLGAPSPRIRGTAAIQVWNDITEEWVVSSADIITAKNPKSYSLGPFVRVGQTFARMMASGVFKLSPSSHTLLWWMLGSANHNNTLYFTRQQMASALGWQRQQLSRALKPLMEGSIVREARLRSPGVVPGVFNESVAFVLSPWMFSKGDDLANLKLQSQWGEKEQLAEMVKKVATRNAMKETPKQTVLPLSQRRRKQPHTAP